MPSDKFRAKTAVRRSAGTPWLRRSARPTAHRLADHPSHVYFHTDNPMLVNAFIALNYLSLHRKKCLKLLHFYGGNIDFLCHPRETPVQSVRFLRGSMQLPLYRRRPRSTWRDPPSLIRGGLVTVGLITVPAPCGGKACRRNLPAPLIGHKQGQPGGTTACTPWPTNRGAGYVALVGSQRKVAAMRQMLGAGGVNAGALARVRAPAGPNIGAVAPEEIALSIVVGIVEVRRRGQAVRRPLHTGRSKA